MSHTPGPWNVRTLERNGEIIDCFVQAKDVNGFSYGAEILGDDEYRDGMERKLNDARLIAASPDLLEALQDAIKTAEFEGHPMRAWHSKARAAISKATNA